MPLATQKRSLWLTLSPLVLITSFVLNLPSAAHAASTVVNGNFSADDDVQSTSFTTLSSQNFTFFTTSYAGGSNADGSTTAAGGFDPILTLFDSTGNTIAYNDDDTTGTVNTDPTTGLAADSFFTQALGPGTYTLAVSEYDNFAPTDSADWSEAGNPDFTSQFSNPFNPSPGPFIDPVGDQRTSAFTFDIVSSPATAPTPETSSAVDLAVFAVIGAWLVCRKSCTGSIHI